MAVFSGPISEWPYSATVEGPAPSTCAYCVVRRELSGGALLAHVFHAGREVRGPFASEDERVYVLSASKAQMEALMADLNHAGIDFKACVETDGPMAGSTPSIGFSLALADKESLKEKAPTLAALRPWRASEG